MEAQIKIALVGANEQQNPLILKAKALGYETHVFAWQTGHEIGAQTADCFYPISVANKEAILEKCRRIGVDAIASLGSDAAARSCAYVAQQLGFPTTAYEAVVEATNKLKTRDIFAKRGIPQPAYLEITDSFDLQKLKELSFPLVVKPSDRSGGRGLSVVCTEKQLFHAINRAREISAEGKAIAEEFVSGQCYSCECISFAGTHRILGFTKREIRRWGSAVVETAHAMPGRLPRSVRQKVEDEIPKILDALAIRYGASSVEFIVDDEKKHSYIEVTPAMYGDFIGSHLVEASTGFDYLQAVLDIALGKDAVAHKHRTVAQAEVRFVCDKQDVPEFSGAQVLSAIDETELPDDFQGGRHGCYLTQRPMKSFGGCHPLELPLQKQKDARFNHATAIALNSEYTALWYVLNIRGIKRLHMPHYMGAAWQRAIADLDIEICCYYVDEYFAPNIFGDYTMEADDAVLLVDYFGLCSRQVPLWVRQLQKKAGQNLCLVVDSTMAYFSEPMSDANVFTIYSCRKFFGVPDGAYLYNSQMQSHPPLLLDTNETANEALAQLIALEKDETAAYKVAQTQEQALIKRRMRMSALTERILQTVDMEAVMEKRRANYMLLASRLQPYQRLPLVKKAEPCSAQCYPLLVSEDIREALLEEKIFVPQLWRKHLAAEFDGTVEQAMAKHLLCLPVEQRYSSEDMCHIADTVVELLS